MSLLGILNSTSTVVAEYLLRLLSVCALIFICYTDKDLQFFDLASESSG